MGVIITIIVFVAILSVLVLIHEAGHFFTAKKLGIKVEEFGFGFPPRVYGKKVGETIYSLNLLPIGGFVKLYGEDDAGAGRIDLKGKKGKEEKEDIKRAFFARNPWQRALIVVAGVVMNFLLAVILLSYLYAFVGVPTPGNHVIVAGIAKDSPAQHAGLKPGDTIVAIDNQKITDAQQLISYTKQHLGKEISLRIKNQESRIKDVKIVPRVHSPANQGAMGVALTQDVVTRKYPWYQAPYVGLKEAIGTSWLIVQGLGTVVGQAFVNRSVPEGVAGPVGMAQLTGQTIQYGFNAVLSWVALLSLNLAVMNILPIPALDGGRLFFILIEAVTGKKVNQQVEAYVHTAGMALLLLFIVFITFHDVVNIVTHKPLIP